MLAAGLGLGLLLGWLSLSPSAPPSGDARAEAKAETSLVITSTGKRLVRAGIGAANFAAARKPAAVGIGYVEVNFGANAILGFLDIYILFSVTIFCGFFVVFWWFFGGFLVGFWWTFGRFDPPALPGHFFFMIRRAQFSCLFAFTSLFRSKWWAYLRWWAMLGCF